MPFIDILFLYAWFDKTNQKDIDEYHRYLVVTQFL